MKKKKFTKTSASPARREREPLPWKYYAVTILFCVILAAGFFHAARLHFFSMEYGAANHSLRSQLEDLKAKQRKLKLNREIALSPNEIKDAATKLGLARITVRNLERLGGVPEAETAVLREDKAETVTRIPVRTYIKEKSSEKAPSVARVPVPTAPKIVKTVKSTRSVPPAEVPKKEEAPANGTRSRIIDTSAKR